VIFPGSQVFFGQSATTRASRARDSQ